MQDYDENEDLTSKLVATFIVDDRLYGLTTDLVREVVRIGEITPVHHAPDFIVGIMNLRGRIVTIIDLGKKIGLNQIEIGQHSRIFIAEWQQEQIGLLVDKVGEVVPFDEACLLPVPENLPAFQAVTLKGVFHSDKMLVGLLSLDAILDEKVEDRLAHGEAGSR
ncbi:MAG: chemotaxis protein CheW [Candidatus Rifleibacteriota bacterium]